MFDKLKKALARPSKAPLVSPEIKVLQDELNRRGSDIIALKAIVANLRKQQPLGHKLYYNPENHKEATIRVAEIFGSFIISRQHGPVVLSKKQWIAEYGHYTELVRIDNTKVVG